MVTIKQARETKGWSQQDFVEKVHMSIAHLSAVENGRPVSPNMLKRICEVLGVDISEIEGVTIARRKQRA